MEGICKKIYTHSVDYSQKINERNQEILKETFPDSLISYAADY